MNIKELIDLSSNLPIEDRYIFLIIMLDFFKRIKEN